MSKLNTSMKPLTNTARQADVAGLGFAFDFSALTSALTSAAVDFGSKFAADRLIPSDSGSAAPVSSPQVVPQQAPQIIYMQSAAPAPAPAPAVAAPASNTSTYLAIGAGVAALAAVVFLMKKRK
jgi:LPXTG-motif cell wall-anchored protein